MSLCSLRSEHSPGLELSVILRWDKAVLIASEECALAHSHFREVERVTNFYCSPPLIPLLLFLSW